MLINYNGKNIALTGCDSLADLFEQISIKPHCQGIAVAINNLIIPKSRWASYQIQEGDRIEVIHAVQGG